MRAQYATMRGSEEDQVFRWIIMAGLLGGLLGCGGTTAEDVKPCAKVGERCRKSAGGLGVCVRNVAQTGFDCSSQN
jgi:hypothetical protein